MKKNISINISGIIFHIEEDGYENLRKYLDSITKYFSSFEDSSEIMADIESRIAEIFLSKLNEGKQVITAEDVTSLISTMGSVSDFKAVEEQEFTQTEPPREKAQQESNTYSSSDTKNKTYSAPRQLMRDQQRKILGGVCTGIANYFNIDAVWVRLLFAVLAFAYGITVIVYVVMWIVVPGSYTLEEPQVDKKMFRDPERKVLGGVCGGVASFLGIDIVIVRVLFIVFTVTAGVGLLVYIVLWIALPEARSLTDRIQMQGEPVTLSNIESNIKKNLNVDQEKEESALTKILLFPFRLIGLLLQGLGKIIGPLVEVLRVAIGIFVSLLGMTMLFAVLVCGGILVGLFSAGAWTELSDISFPAQMFTESFPGWIAVAAFVGAIIPAIFIVLLGVSIIAKKIIFAPAVGWALFVMFFASAAMLSIGIPKIIYAFKEDGSYKVETVYTPVGKTLVLKMNEIGMDDYHGVDLTIRGYDEKEIKLVQEFKAQGSSRQKAIENAQMVTYHVDVKDSVFTFDSNLHFNEGAKFRAQRLDMTLYVPYDYQFTMTEDVSRFITQYVDHNYLDDHNWRMTPKGMDCLSCPVAYGDPETAETTSEAFSLSDFDEVEVSGIYYIRLTKGTDYSVELIGSEHEKEKYKITREGSTLIIDYSDHGNFSWGKDFLESHEIQINITMPELERLEAKGAGKINFEDFTSPDIEIELLGAMKARGDIQSKNVTVNLSGASELELNGTAATLEATVQGASSLLADDFEVRDATVEVNGASSAKVNVTGTLEMQEGIASDIDYRGNPKVIKRD
ncbi:MAG TPA: PspC domain-containing protein [Ohtaekwangia sp.]